MATEDSTPGVRFPPPLIFTLGLLAGWALDRWVRPLPLVGPDHRAWLYLHAAAFGLVALWLLGSALGVFRRQGNDPRPWREDSALVVGGLYRYTRNPMYLGMALLVVALALALDSLWPLLTLVPVLAIVRAYVIGREEAYLAKRFGIAYLDYKAKVPRWL
jgi:protein-S-isoprenylcysteine O-methyltransferase Ste14